MAPEYLILLVQSIILPYRSDYQNLINLILEDFLPELPTCILNAFYNPHANKIIQAIEQHLLNGFFTSYDCKFSGRSNILVLSTEHEISETLYSLTETRFIIYSNDTPYKKDRNNKLYKWVNRNTISLKQRILKISRIIIFRENIDKNNSQFEIWTKKYTAHYLIKMSNLKMAFFNRRPNFNKMPLIIRTTLIGYFDNSANFKNGELEVIRNLFEKRYNATRGENIGFTIAIGTDKLTWQDNADNFRFHSIRMNTICFVVHKGEPYPEWQALIRCFHWSTWLSLTVIWLICSLVWSRINENQWGFKSLTDMLSLFTTHTATWFHSTTRNKSRILTGIITFISLIVITGLLQSLLYRNLKSPGRYPPINSLKELLNTNITIYCKTFPICIYLFNLVQISLNTGDTVLVSFEFDTTKIDYEKLYMNRDIIFVTYCNEAYTTIKVIPQYKKQLHISKEVIGMDPWMITASRNHIYYWDEIINDIFRLYESGINDWSEYMHRWNQQMKLQFRERPSSSLKVFSLKDLQIAFFVSLFGNLFAFFVFIVEIINATRTY